jgi:hypothetical protein
MPSRSQPTRLLPQQTRTLHAGAGVRLWVVSGRLWLTQPNAAQDLFLGPGAMIDLKQDWVVLQADSGPGGVGLEPCHAEYQLLPLVAPVPSRLGLALRRLAQWLAAKKSRIANRVASGVSLIW